MQETLGAVTGKAPWQISWWESHKTVAQLRFDFHKIIIMCLSRHISNKELLDLGVLQVERR